MINLSNLLMSGSTLTKYLKGLNNGYIPVVRDTDDGSYNIFDGNQYIDFYQMNIDPLSTNNM